MESAAKVQKQSEPSHADRQHDEEEAAAYASETGIPYFDTRSLEIIETNTEEISLETFEHYRVAPLHRYNAQSFELGLTPQTNRTQLVDLQQHFPGVQLTFKTISSAGYTRII